MKTLIVSLVRQTEQGTMSPVELFWTVKKHNATVFKGAANYLKSFRADDILAWQFLAGPIVIIEIGISRFHLHFDSSCLKWLLMIFQPNLLSFSS